MQPCSLLLLTLAVRWCCVLLISRLTDQCWSKRMAGFYSCPHLTVRPTRWVYELQLVFGCNKPSVWMRTEPITPEDAAVFGEWNETKIPIWPKLCSALQMY